MSWLWTGNEFTERVVLTCIGIKSFNVDSHLIQPLVQWIGANIFGAEIPTYVNRQGKEMPYWPSSSTIDTYDGVADTLCDIRHTMLTMGSGRDTAARGGDAVLDNHVGMTADDVTSSGEKFQNGQTKFRDLGTATFPLKPMPCATGAAKAASIDDMFTENQILAEELRKQRVALPKSLTMLGESTINERDAEAITKVILKVSTTDRGAPEYKALVELDKLKERELMRIMGRRLIRSRALLMLQVRPSSPTSAHVAMRWVGPSLEAHNICEEDKTELNKFCLMQGLTKSMLARALNKVLAVKTREPLPAIVQTLRVYAKALRAGRRLAIDAQDAVGAQKPAAEDEAAFDGELAVYMLKHRLVMVLQDAVNDAMNALMAKCDDDSIDNVSSDFLLREMVASIEDCIAGKTLGPEYEDVEGAPAGQAGWYALPLRPPLNELDELEQEVAARDKKAEELGEWIVSSYTDEERKYYILTEWINCHEQ